jgi:Sulfocyanin (SoxE) domain
MTMTTEDSATAANAPAGPPGKPQAYKLGAAARSMKPTLIAIGALMTAAIIAVAVALVARSTDTNGIPVGLTEYKIAMPAKLSVGVNTFALTNNGTIAHELVIFKTDLNANNLPLEASGDVNEESPLLRNVADSGEPLKAGVTRVVKTDVLSPGHYVAVCNLPAHYRLGMRLNVTVP